MQAHDFCCARHPTPRLRHSFSIPRLFLLVSVTPRQVDTQKSIAMEPSFNRSPTPPGSETYYLASEVGRLVVSALRKDDGNLYCARG